jgi:uncharacterized membrane protein YqjE
VVTEPGTPAGPTAALGRLAVAALDTLRTRVALAGTELEREKLRAFDALVLAALGLLLAALALVLALGFLVLLLQEGYRLAAVGVLALAFGGGAVLLLRRARAGLQAGAGGPFALTIEELQRDMQALRAAAAALTPAAAPHGTSRAPSPAPSTAGAPSAATSPSQTTEETRR